MKRNRIAILFFLVSLLTASCTKMDALFNNGTPVTEQRNLEQSFEVICMYNNVNVNLVRDNHPHLELTCPENLIDNITTEIRHDSLIIKNENDFNWLRSYDYSIDLTIYYDSLREINYASTARLFSSDTLRGCYTIDTVDGDYKRSFMLRIKEGCGDIDLTFNCEVLRDRFFNGTSYVILRGVAGYSEHIVRSYGTVHAEGLDSNIITVLSESTNDLYIKIRNGGSLRAQLYSIGNLYYQGNPNPHLSSFDCYSDGQAIKIQ